MTYAKYQQPLVVAENIYIQVTKNDWKKHKAMFKYVLILFVYDILTYIDILIYLYDL